MSLVSIFLSFFLGKVMQTCEVPDFWVTQNYELRVSFKISFRKKVTCVFHYILLYFRFFLL